MSTLQSQLAALRSGDKESQGQAFQELVTATSSPVPWAYDAWDALVELLGDKDNRSRSISSQVLCNLAKSDPQRRILKTLPKLFEVTKDERFVTARHCLQSLWKVAVVGDEQKKAVVKGLATRFKECTVEKNCTLIRYDIQESLRKIYDAAPDEKMRKMALELIELEDDLKYRKKYAAVWKNA